MNRKPRQAEISLAKMLEEAAENMASNLRSKLLKHPGELGTAREQILRDFLRAHLPKRFEVSTGFAFDCNGQMSKQLDVVIFDATVCPRIEIPGHKFLFPCEAVVAVGEVKSSVTSRQQFRDALENLSSAKALDRSAKGTAYDSRYGETLSPKDNHLHQIFSFLFITGDAMNPDALGLTLLEDTSEIPVQLLPNIVVALDRYLVTYCCDDGICPNTMHARGVAVQATTKPADAILRFYLLLGRAIDVIRTSSLPYWEYLSQYNSIPAKVFHSSVETPPPYLGKWTEGD